MSVRSLLKPESEAYYRCPSDNLELTDAHVPDLTEAGKAEYERLRKQIEEPAVLLDTCIRENAGFLHWHPNPMHPCYKPSDVNGGAFACKLRYMDNGVVCTTGYILYQRVVGDLVHVLTLDDGSGKTHFAFKVLA